MDLHLVHNHVLITTPTDDDDKDCIAYYVICSSYSVGVYLYFMWHKVFKVSLVKMTLFTCVHDSICVFSTSAFAIDVHAITLHVAFTLFFIIIFMV